eukprot:30430-Amphidinium_carterae.2
MESTTAMIFLSAEAASRTLPFTCTLHTIVFDDPHNIFLVHNMQHDKGKWFTSALDSALRAAGYSSPSFFPCFTTG